MGMRPIIPGIGGGTGGGGGGGDEDLSEVASLALAASNAASNANNTATEAFNKADALEDAVASATLDASNALDVANTAAQAVEDLADTVASLPTDGTPQIAQSLYVSSWGDSRVNQNTSTAHNTPGQLFRSWVWWAEGMSQRFRANHQFNMGVSGDKNSDMRARIVNDTPNTWGVKPSDVPPGLAFVLCGTNDVSGNIPLATITADIKFVVDWLTNRGFQVVIVAEWPRGLAASPLTTSRARTMYAYANYLRSLRAPNVWVADVWPRLADPAQIDARPIETMLSTDGIHSSPGVAYVTGKALARVLSEEMKLPRLKMAPSSNGDQYDNEINLRGCLNTNPMLRGGGGNASTNASGDVPLGYTMTASGGLTVVGSFVNIVVDGEARQAFRMVITGTTTSANGTCTLSQTGLIGKVAAGDTVESGVEVVIHPGHTNFSGPGLQIDTGVTASSGYGGLQSTGDQAIPAGPAAESVYGMFRSNELPLAALPASLTHRIRLGFTANGAPTNLTIDVLSTWIRKQ